ncbi:MAG: amidohydrolase [Anaerolineae bacterium]|nr:amidohydrolase [Anaerolineae bacterium]
MNIDIHAHIIVPEITRAATPAESWRPNVGWDNGRQFVEFGGKRLGSALREFVDMEAMLAEQDKAGVDKLLLSPWSSLFRYEADLDDSVQANRIQNDALAAIVKAYGPRVAAVGTVPLQESQAAVAELTRAVTELGLLGVEIGTNVNGTYLGDPQFRPFWAAAEALGAFIEIHPVSGVAGSATKDYYLWNAYANPAETALTAAHMVMSGLLEEHPNLKICLFHGGGHLPYQIGRLDRAYEVRPEARQKISAPPSSYFKKFYFDTITHSGPALAYLIDLVGVEQVLLGSDYPFDMGYDRPAELVEQLPGLSEADKQAILGGNAQRLLNLDS